MSKLIVAQIRDLLNQVMNKKISFSRFVEILNESKEPIKKLNNMENKIDIQQLIDRNYAAQVRRGQITPETNAYEFIEKIDEEVEELNVSIFRLQEKFQDGLDDKELIDIMLVCFSMAKHFGIDWQQVMKDKVEFNETRED